MRRSSLALLLSVFSLAACAGPRPTDLPPAPASSVTVPVQSGETLAAVASRYQVKEDDILALNKISNRNSLQAGRLRIPAYGYDREPIAASLVRETPREPAARSTQVAATNKAPASASRVDMRPLAAPPNGATRQTQTASNVPPTSRNPQAVPQQPAAQPAPPAQPVPQQSWMEWFGMAPPAIDATTPRATFLWPVNGRVISSFGQSADGERNDGINISARLGTPIHAADAGVVTYVGNELKGYGNLVLILHDNGYVTAYAHAERVDVQRGDRVARGQVIGTAGDTGDVREPQVHFELRVGTKPVDPTPYLVVAM